MISSRKTDLELPKRDCDNRSRSPYSPSFKTGRHGSVSPPKHRHIGRRDRDNLSPRDFDKPHGYNKNHCSPRKQRFREGYRTSGGSSLKHSQKASNHLRYPGHGGKTHDHYGAPSPKKARHHSPPGVPSSAATGNVRKRSSYADKAGGTPKVEKEGGKVSKDSGKLPSNVEKVTSPVSLRPYLEDIDSDEDLGMTMEVKHHSSKHTTPEEKASKPLASPDFKEGDFAKRMMKEELFDMMEELETDITTCEHELQIVKAKQSLLEGAKYRYQLPGRATFTSTVEDLRHPAVEAPGVHTDLYRRIYSQNRALKSKSRSVGSVVGTPLETTAEVQYNQPFDAPGYWDVVERHQACRPKLLEILAGRRKEQYSLEMSLCEKYDSLSEQWEKRLERLERKTKDHKTRELFEKVFPELKRIKEPSDKLNRMDSRGIGIIRSEAELAELMDALSEQEESKDRHRRCHAVIPPMVIHPLEARRSYSSTNGLLEEPMKAHQRYVDTAHSCWNREERVTFHRVYALYPKNFEKIAKFLPSKTVEQCVHFYYLTKKSEDYSYKMYVQAVKEERRRRGLAKSAQESPTSPSGMLPDAKEEGDAQPVSRRPTLLKPKAQRLNNTGSPYGDWSLDEIERLKEGLRVHGKAWWRVSQVVNSKNQNKCRMFFTEHHSSKGLFLNEAVDVYLRNKATQRVRKKGDAKPTEPLTPVAKTTPKCRPLPKVKQEEEAVESGEESSGSGSSSGDSSETHTAVSSNDEMEEEPMTKPPRRVQVMRSMSVPRRFSEDSLDVLFTAAEIVEGGTVPSSIALHDHTYALSQRHLYQSMDHSPTSGLSLIAAAAAVVSPSLQGNSSSTSPLLAPVKAPRGRPPNSSKRLNSASQRLQPTFLSPAGPNMQVHLMDQKGGPRARSRSTGNPKPAPPTTYLRSTSAQTPRNLLSPTKPKPATPTSLPPMLPVAKTLGPAALGGTAASTPSTPNTAFEALVNAAVAAPPAVLEKTGEGGESKLVTKDAGDSPVTFSPSKSGLKPGLPVSSSESALQHQFPQYGVFPYYPTTSGANGQQWMPQPTPFPFQIFYSSAKMYPHHHHQPVPNYPMLHMHYPPPMALSQTHTLALTGSLQSPTHVLSMAQPATQQTSKAQSGRVEKSGHESATLTTTVSSLSQVVSASVVTPPGSSSLVQAAAPSKPPPSSPSVLAPTVLTHLPLLPQSPSGNSEKGSQPVVANVTSSDSGTVPKSTPSVFTALEKGGDGIKKGTELQKPESAIASVSNLGPGTVASADVETNSSTAALEDLLNRKSEKALLKSDSPKMKPDCDEMIDFSKLLNHHSLSSASGQDREVEERLKHSEALGSMLAMEPLGASLPSSVTEFNHERFSPNMAALSLFSSIPGSHGNNTPSPQSSSRAVESDTHESGGVESSKGEDS